MASNPPVTRLSLPSIPEFTAWMTIEGEEAPLYGIEEKGNKSICYVESKTGQHFSVHFQDTRLSRSVGLTVELHMYGQWQRARVIELQGSQELFLAARRDGPTSERPFIFENIKTTDDEDLACTSEVIHKSLGNVNLLLKRWKNCTKRRSGTRDYEYNKDSEPTIHEDSKKAQVSHAISFGQARPTTATHSQWHYDYIDKVKSPFHDIEFRCRSREILESLGLVAVPPTARSESEDSPVADPSRSRSKSSNASSDARPRSKSASNPLAQAPIIISDDEEEPVSEAELSRLQDELAELERQSRMAAIKRRMSGGSTSSGVKREGEEEGVGSGGNKKVKLEKGGNGGSLGGMSKGKGKEKVAIVLSDSD